MQENIYKLWYENLAVKYEIFNSMKKKELAILTPKHKGQNVCRRYMFPRNVQQLSFFIDKYLLREPEKFNLYSSVAEYIDTPYISDDLILRSPQIADWIEVHHKDINKYYLFIDIDCPDFSDNNREMLRYSVLNIMDFLDKHEVPYKLRFSGKGFHLFIPTKFTDFDPMRENNIYRQCNKIAKFFYDNFTEFVDYTIYDSRRLHKALWSLAVYPDRIHVCLPITTKTEIEEFNWDYFRPEQYISILDKKLFNTKEVLFNPKGNFDNLTEAISQWKKRK
jgi:hypothetical protein